MGIELRTEYQSDRAEWKFASKLCLNESSDTVSKSRFKVLWFQTDILKSDFAVLSSAVDTALLVHKSATLDFDSALPGNIAPLNSAASVATLFSVASSCRSRDCSGVAELNNSILNGLDLSFIMYFSFALDTMEFPVSRLAIDLGCKSKVSCQAVYEMGDGRWEMGDGGS
ncbi:hypothetical protein BHE74_00015751 [Ensete ventricosum]|nr:hypothetical protein BHE74_00015751 [Ensete ventricosum]